MDFVPYSKLNFVVFSLIFVSLIRDFLGYGIYYFVPNMFSPFMSSVLQNGHWQTVSGSTLFILKIRISLNNNIKKPNQNPLQLEMGVSKELR